MSTNDRNRVALLALKLKAGIPLSPDEQTEWDRNATWRERLSLLASQLRAGATLSPEDQAYWDREARWANKIEAGLPLTPQEQWLKERAEEAVYSLRSGDVLVVEAPPMSVAQWKEQVARSRGHAGPLLSPEEPKTE